jgi:hypothetical protein
MTEQAPPKTAPWRPFTEEQYRDVIGHLVHFSTKTINTNAKPTGIRLDPADTTPSRYLCASSALASGYTLPLDYLTNSGPTATISKQLSQVLNDGLPDDADPDSVALIRRLYDEACNSPLLTGNEKVSPRLRQLLLPCDDGSYVAITPITSSGLTAAVNERTKANRARWRDTQDKHNSDICRLKTAYLGLGGANPVNIGRLANNWLLQYPLFFSAPHNDQSVTQQYLAAHRGVRPLLNRAIMVEIRDSLLPIQQHSNGELPSNLKTRNTADQLIVRLVGSLLQRAENTREEAIRIIGPAEADAATETNTEDNRRTLQDRWGHLSNVQQGLLEPELRSKAWREELAAEMVSAIDGYPYPDEGKRGSLSLGRQWLNRIERRIEENLI